MRVQTIARSAGVAVVAALVGSHPATAQIARLPTIPNGPVPTTAPTAAPPRSSAGVSPVTDPSPQFSKDLETAASDSCENWSFERGLTCWTVMPLAKPGPAAFSLQPTFGDNVVASRVMKSMELSAGGIGGDYWKRLPYPTGGVKKSASLARESPYQSQYWIGTFEDRPTPSAPHGWTRGETAQGELRSKPFRIRTRYVSFLVGGGKTTNVGVKLEVPQSVASRLAPAKLAPRVSSDGWVEVAVAKGNDSEIMRRHVWDVAKLLSLTDQELKRAMMIARVSIFDFDTRAFGHISADDFRFTAEPPATFTVRENDALVERDIDMPVWGFADTHTHPAHQLAFGGRTIGGDPDGPMSEALATKKCTGIHAGALRVMGGRNHMHAAIGAVDEHLADGYPTFIGWPSYRTKTHQVQHVDWLKRAFDGGERLIVMLGVTNMFWATRALGPGIDPSLPVDDETTALQQIQTLKEVAARHSSWMEVVTSPEQARRAIHNGKLAVVLGLEIDNFGNFKDKSYVWRDGGNYSLGPSNRLVTLPDELNAARAAIRTKLDAYAALGLRQMTPLHYISGVFGGTAVFRSQFGLVNEAFTGKPYLLRNARPEEGVWYNVARDWSAFQGILGAGTSSPAPYVRCVDGGAFCGTSSVNAEGLTSRGRILIEELMRKGMLVDFEHASAGSFAAIKEIADRYRYPLMSSHSDARELSFTPKHGAPFSGNPERDFAEYGTTQIGNVTHEGMLGAAGFQAVRDSGGTAGVITLAYRKRGFPNDERPTIANNCDGSTTTFAQSYLYAVDKLRGNGVGIATDRGFTDFIGPRFGTHAAYKLRDESLDALRVARRQAQKNAQSNGVRYDVPFTFFHPSRFEFGETTIEEEDTWKAMAYWTATHMSPLDPRYASLPADRKIPSSSQFGNSDRIESLVRGLAATSLTQLRVCCGDTPWEEAAMFAIKGNMPVEWLRTTLFYQDKMPSLRRAYMWIKPVYDLWNRMAGNNEPLRKRIDGVRDWDVNLDGVAHYGMLPDMIQDLANIGLTPPRLAPLFYSAEDYILMWERAVRASAVAFTSP